MALLATKLLLAPLCVVVISLAGRRWGTAVTGILGGTPVVAGPILLVVTIDHGRSFGTDAATATLFGLVALSLFVFVYDRLAQRLMRPLPTLLCGWLAFLAGIAVLNEFEPDAVVAMLLACASFLGTRALLPAPADSIAPISAVVPWWDLPARAAAAVTLVVAITTAAGALGPSLSGLLTPFPVLTSVLAIFTHIQGGPTQIRIFLRNFLIGIFGFASFCFVLALALPEMGTAAAFLLALLVSVIVQTGIFVFRRPARKPGPKAVAEAERV